jgi:hypothetical protein
MDPLSPVASVVAVVGAVQSACRPPLRLFKALKNAPQELQDLRGEVAQIEAVLGSVKSAVEMEQRSTSALDILLNEAKNKLLELNKLIHDELTKGSEKIRVDRIAWATHQSKAARKQEELRELSRRIGLQLLPDILYVNPKHHASASRNLTAPFSNVSYLVEPAFFCYAPLEVWGISLSLIANIS